MTTWALVVAVVFVMTGKPGAEGCVMTMLVAVALGGLAAVPMWRAEASDAPAADRATS
jgi:hypothetical protein